MRQRHTFVLTILLDDQDPSFLRGRVLSVTSAEEITFVEVDGLIRFIRAQIKPDDVPAQVQAAMPERSNK